MNENSLYSTLVRCFKMSHSLRSIGEPYTIAHIPKPLDSAHGQTYASDVYSLVGSKKRKRSEIAFASDGESIGVYEVSTPLSSMI